MSRSAAPFVITFLEPPGSRLDGYDRRLSASEQTATPVPQTFRDAMAVREAVFVREQGVPLENELDEDDPRSCHWVAYVPVPAAGEGKDVELTMTTTTTALHPVATVRLVPFPHAPHPQPGGVYAVVSDGSMALTGIREEGPGGADEAVIRPLTEAEAKALEAAGEGRATSLHDGREPYVKLGRLAVLPGFRGMKLSRALVEEALTWMTSHPGYFDPPSNAPRFNGLVCAHAQDQAAGAWARLGFHVDEGMGRFWEEGIPHSGMFRRLELKPERAPEA